MAITLDQYATPRIIREEHAVLSAMLRAILQLLEQHRAEKTMPDFVTLRAMLFYINEFPEKRHHRKESELLFPTLRAKAPLARHLLDQLDEEHALGERNVRALEHALIRFEMLGDLGRQPFERATQRFADFYVSHMAMEELHVLPLAKLMLSPSDWADLDEAFLANDDPLAERAVDNDYRTLFSHLVNVIPSCMDAGSVPLRLHL
jgi:hemerythrin-like domain-containing protein